MRTLQKLRGKPIERLQVTGVDVTFMINSVWSSISHITGLSLKYGTQPLMRQRPLPERIGKAASWIAWI